MNEITLEGSSGSLPTPKFHLFHKYVYGERTKDEGGYPVQIATCKLCNKQKVYWLNRS